MEFEITASNKTTSIEEILENIPVLNKISYNEFFNKYMLENKPCVIQNVTELWEASSKWLTEDKVPDVFYLTQKYGDCSITVYDCNQKYYNSQQTQTCKLKVFLHEQWKAHDSLMYLKDWNLKNSQKEDSFYNVPIYFASDWLNEYLTAENKDDYRFVYMGQAQTW